VIEWPDTCVGDFPRCYLLDRDEDYLFPHLCAYPTLAVPERTTHIRVYCTADKTLQKEKLSRTDDVSKFETQQIEFFQRLYVFVAVYLIAAILCCFASFSLVKCYAIKPYLKVVERNQYTFEMGALTISSDLERLGEMRGID
jgi:hypothetical protein